MLVPVRTRSRVALLVAMALAGGAFSPIGCARETTNATGGGDIADPTLLPVATIAQGPDVAAYAALNIANRPAGSSYNDPVTGVRVWKVTSSTVPAANTGAGHDYGDGSNQVSRGWGAEKNTHTILIRGDGIAYYLVDFTRGVGFANYRRIPDAAQPDRDLCFTFSSVASQPRIAYVLTNDQLVRFNTETMAIENTGTFPLNLSPFAWLHQDKDDVWFTGLLFDQHTAFAWNSRTNAYLTRTETWLNEPRFERDGRYVVLTGGGSGPLRYWDLSNNTLGPVQDEGTSYYFSHLASLRSRWVAVNPNGTIPFVQDRYQVNGGTVTKTTVLNQSAGTEVNNSGNWIQSDAELGGNLNRQWAYVSGVDEETWSDTLLFDRAVGVVRADGSEQRLLLHYYGVDPLGTTGYYSLPWAQPSPDGKVVIFNSNMNGSGRYDLFVAEVPLRSP